MLPECACKQLMYVTFGGDAAAQGNNPQQTIAQETEDIWRLALANQEKGCFQQNHQQTE